jgi:hypothetical protein
VQRTRPDLDHEPREKPVAPAPRESHPVLTLQRQFGNQAVTRMIVARQPAFGTTDADTWKQEVKAGRNKPLYAEIATMVGTAGLTDIKGTSEKDINGALRAGFDELKPGLNYVPKLEPLGRTGFLHEGKFDAHMPTTRDGPLPQNAICLGNKAFEPDNKAHTVTVYRHELEHGLHNRLAIDWLVRWRGDAAAEKVPFLSWLEKQKMSAVDRALVKEAAKGSTPSTESLAHAAGFIAGFGLEKAGIELADRPVTEELEKLADHWLSAPETVQNETVARLKAYAASLKDRERRATFRKTLEGLKAKSSALAKLTDPVLAVL